MSVTRTFDRDYLVDELDLPHLCTDKEIVGQGRWTTHFTGIAEIDGAFWRFSWSEGSTEYQDESPWEYETEVVGTQVEKRQVLVDQWVEVEA